MGTTLGRVGSFVPDDINVEIYGTDLAWPFALTGTGDLAVVDGEANLVSALPIRAVTRRGEIPLFPDDGIDLDDFQSAPASDGERAALSARLLEQYRRDDRLRSVRVTVEEDGDDVVAHIDGIARTGRALEPVDVTFGGA